jgi:hypothetical protein
MTLLVWLAVVGDQFGETASNQSIKSLATVACEVIRRG